MLEITRRLGCTRGVPLALGQKVEMSRYLAPTFIRMDNLMSNRQRAAAQLVLHQKLAAGIVRTVSFWGEAGYAVVAFDEADWPYFRQGEEVVASLGVRLEDYQNKPAPLLALELVAAASKPGMMNVCVEWGMQVGPDTYIYSNGMVWSGLTPYQLPATGPYQEDKRGELPLMVETTTVWRDRTGQPDRSAHSYKEVVFETRMMLAAGHADAVIVVLGHPAEGEADTMLLHYLPADESLAPADDPDRRWQTEAFFAWCRGEVAGGNFSRIGYRLKKSGQPVLYQLTEGGQDDAGV